MSTPKSTKARAFPRSIKVQKTDIPRMEELIAGIPYNHRARKINPSDNCSWVMYTIRLKTQELLAFELAGYDIARLGRR